MSSTLAEKRTLKTCTACKKAMPLSAFSPCRNTYQPSCKKCRNYKAAALNIRVTVEEQRCVQCETVKPASEFNRCKHRKSGLQGSCKECDKARKRAVFFEVTLTQKTCCDCGETKSADCFPRDHKRKGGLRKECRECASLRCRSTIYKISYDECKARCSRSACEICMKSFELPRDKHIDHCHRTGAVRGTLCGNCNRMLGAALDRPDVLIAAANYLRERSGGVKIG